MLNTDIKTPPQYIEESFYDRYRDMNDYKALENLIFYEESENPNA